MGQAVDREVGSDQDISWLLLQSAQHAGRAILSTVDYIQRLHTRGGVAPNAGHL
jgi:hypothetical protein